MRKSNKNGKIRRLDEFDWRGFSVLGPFLEFGIFGGRLWLPDAEVHGIRRDRVGRLGMGSLSNFSHDCENWLTSNSPNKKIDTSYAIPPLRLQTSTRRKTNYWDKNIQIFQYIFSRPFRGPLCKKFSKNMVLNTNLNLGGCGGGNRWITSKENETTNSPKLLDDSSYE